MTRISIKSDRILSAHNDRAAGYYSPRTRCRPAALAPPRVSDEAQDFRIPKRALLLVGLLAVIPYLNAAHAGFTFDDEYQIRTNPAVQSGVNLPRILSSPLYPGTIFRPLTVLTFALNEWLTPGRAAAFHVTNVLLHVLVSFVVCILAGQLFRSSRIAIWSAGLFAVHPIHTEAVTSLVGRSELLAALCGLAALWTAGPARAGCTQFADLPRRYLSLVLFCFALLSKESALAILPALLLFRVTLRQDTLARGLWKELLCLDWVPYVLCAAAFVWWRAVVISVTSKDLTPLDNVLAFVPWPVRVRSALAILWDYLGLLNVPLVLAADYSYNQTPPVSSWWAFRFVAGAALIGVAALVCVRRRWTGAVFALALPFIALSLTGNLLFPIGTVKAERLLYLPSVGWALLAGWGFDRLMLRARYRALATTLLGLVLLSFAVRTWLRNADWHDESAVYESMVRDSPGSAKAHYNLGVALQHRGDYTEATAQFQRALEIYPWLDDAALGIGTNYERQGQIDAAAEWYAKALHITPSFNEAHIGLCRVYVNSARFDKAAAACRQGLRYRPADADLLKGLGVSLTRSGETEKGLEVLRRSFAMNPADEQLRRYLGERTSNEGPGE